MFDVLIELIIFLVIVGLLWWALNSIMAALAPPEPIRTVITVVFVVVICLVLISLLTGLIPGHHLVLLR